ncbi:MAG: hypothetical protein HY466_04220 [Deltaproteobacteria bacterium]|nr:hypothetical protein [Deltaproteobacteria bacterium]
MKPFFLYLGVAAGFVLPFFNIPFIFKIRKNKSSKDISLVWAVGIFICVVLMLPQAWLSQDLSFKIFGIVNFILYSAAFYHIIYYRKGQ